MTTLVNRVMCKRTNPSFLTTLLIGAFLVGACSSDDDPNDPDNNTSDGGTNTSADATQSETVDAGPSDEVDSGGGGSELCSESFSGTVANEGEATFTFDVTTDGTVAIDLSWFGSSDLDLHLLSESGGEITRSENDGGGVDENITEFLQEGRYQAYIVQWDDTSADYELTVACK